MDEKQTEIAAVLFGALSNPTRVAIVDLLSTGPQNVTAIAEHVGITQPGASQHLAVLERAGLLRVTKSGTNRIYDLRGPRVARVVSLVFEFCQVHGLTGDLDEPGDASA